MDRRRVLWYWKKGLSESQFPKGKDNSFVFVCLLLKVDGVRDINGRDQRRYGYVCETEKKNDDTYLTGTRLFR